MKGPRQLSRVFLAVTYLYVLPTVACHRDPSLQQAEPDFVYQLQEAEPDQLATSGFEIIIMDISRDGTPQTEYTQQEIQALLDHGKQVLAYISIGEAENYRWYWQSSWSSSSPSFLGPENPEWPGNYLVKYWDPAWHSIILNYIDRVIALKFSGVYLDKVDAWEDWTNYGLPPDSMALAMVRWLKQIINYIRTKAPHMKIVPQNGLSVLQYDSVLLQEVDGWGVEDLFYYGTRPRTPEETTPRLYWLKKLVRDNKLVLVTDYIVASPITLSSPRVELFHGLCREYGFIPYAATADRELNTIVTVPRIQP